MENMNFEIRALPAMWAELGMDVERFERMRLMLGDIYARTFLTQPDRPYRMAYFDNLMAEIHGGGWRSCSPPKRRGGRWWGLSASTCRKS